MSNAAIRVENLKKIFKTPGDRKGHTVLSDISFEVPRGTSVAVTGANGSGKTTLLKVLSTLYLPDEGKCSILGYDLVKDQAMIRKRISFVSPGLDFQRKLTLDENLKFFARVQDSDPDNAYKFLDEMNLLDKIDDRTETFSEGQKAITRLAIGLMKSVDILLLDEVTLGNTTHVTEAAEGTLREFDWTPADFGLEPVAIERLRVDGPQQSAEVISQMLDGQAGPARDVVVANAAAALLTAGRAASLSECVRLAGDAIASGAASELLARLVDRTAS